MKLMTKQIEKAARKQYNLGSDLDQNVVAKFFDPCGSWSWFVMNQDPDNPEYLWGIIKGFEVEQGSFSLSELQNYRGRLGLGIERDISFRPQPARGILHMLLEGKHV